VKLIVLVWQEKQGTRRLVLALYPFKAIEPGDLSLEKVITTAHTHNTLNLLCHVMSLSHGVTVYLNWLLVHRARNTRLWMTRRSTGGKSGRRTGTLKGLSQIGFYLHPSTLAFLFNRVMGYIPSNYVKEKELIGLQQWEWVQENLFPIPDEPL